MKETIIALLKKSPKKPLSAKQISQALNQTDAASFKALMKTLNELVDACEVIVNDRHQYAAIEHTNFATGILDLKDKGFGFLTLDDSDDDDIYIPAHKMKDAMHKDRVLVHIESSRRGLRKEGEVKRILERHLTTIVGTVMKRGKRFELVSDEKNIKHKINIRKNGLNGASEHDKVQAMITSYAFKGVMEVEVIHIIGHMNEAGVDILSKILKHNVDPAFPKKVLDEAEQYQTLDKKDFEGREDYRDHNIVTIDGETAKDFDDAIEVIKKDEDTFYLAVHIADVSHYVKEQSELDKEAYRRGTSIYLVDRVIPMLPENLSNNLCSLMPNVDRFVISCEMEIDAKGKIKSHRIFPSVMRSKARMTYTKVNAILEGDKALAKQYEHQTEMFHQMADLAAILRKKRTHQGSIHFETDEPYIKLDKDGRAIDVSLRERGESERIIEEFMLIANQVIAEHVSWLELPFIYRVHESPKEEKLERLLTMSQALGFKVKAKSEITHKELQKLLQRVEDTASEKGMNLMMLRSMQKAIYSPSNLGHFGLAFDHYTHFTSPIRRYSDLIVHRLLREYFFNKNQTEKTIKHYDSIMRDIANQTSTKEREAIGLERDVLDMKKAEYMSQFIGEKFKGTISSVTAFGVYVGLPNTVEGLVHISELDDDYYEFNEDLLFLVGQRTKRMYRIGDEVTVEVMNTNVFDGEIDFKIR